MEEMWVSIEGYEGLYEVSNLGRVKALERVVPCLKHFKKLKQIVLRGDNSKYKEVTLSKNGVKKNHKVHLLVLSAFCIKPFADAVARHKNDIPSDNRKDNLCWGTVSENTKDKFKNGYKHHRRSLSDKEVIGIYLEDSSQRSLAKRYGTNQRTVWAIKNRKSYKEVLKNLNFNKEGYYVAS